MLKIQIGITQAVVQGRRIMLVLGRLGTAAVIAAATVLGMGQGAEAGLFVSGSTFTVDASSSPDTFFETATLPGTTLLDGGKLSLTVSIVPDGSNEWLVFKYSTTSGGVLSPPGGFWKINQTGLDAAVPINFIAAFVDFSSGATVLTPTSSIFGGYSVEADPVPGETGTGLGASGFSALFPAGPLPALGAFISPWSFLSVTGIDSTLVNGYEMALEFAPQVAAVPEPASLVLLGGALLGLGVIRRRRRKAV